MTELQFRTYSLDRVPPRRASTPTVSPFVKALLRLDHDHALFVKGEDDVTLEALRSRIIAAMREPIGAKVFATRVDTTRNGIWLWHRNGDAS
jgi:hypothetical protein